MGCLECVPALLYQGGKAVAPCPVALAFLSPDTHIPNPNSLQSLPSPELPQSLPSPPLPSNVIPFSYSHSLWLFPLPLPSSLYLFPSALIVTWCLGCIPSSEHSTQKFFSC